MSDREDAVSTRNSHPEGWLRQRLKPFGWSLLRFARQIKQPYHRVMKWNSGRDVPPEMEVWLDKLDGFLIEQPPPRPEVLAKRGGQTAFVKRIMAVMQPGEAVSVVDLSDRLSISRKTLVNRLLDAARQDRLAPLRRIQGENWLDPSFVHWMLPGDPDLITKSTKPTMTAFISKIVDAIPVGQEVELPDLADRLWPTKSDRAVKLYNRLIQAQKVDRLGPLEIVDNGPDRQTAIRHNPPEISAITEKRLRMSPQEFRHATEVLGLDEGEIIRQTAMLPGQFDRMLSGQIPVPPTLEAWLKASLEMKRQKELQEKWLRDQQDSASELVWAQECMDYLGWNHTQLGKIVGLRDPREPRRWFTTSLPDPVADLLDRACRAKEAAIATLPDDLDETQAAAAVSAAVMASLGDLTKIRDAILAERHAATKAHWEMKTTAQKAVLHWIGEGADIPEDDPAQADVKAALAATIEDAQSAETWAKAAIAWLEQEGYGFEDDPLQEILGTDHPSERGLLRTPGRYVVDLTRREDS